MTYITNQTRRQLQVIHYSFSVVAKKKPSVLGMALGIRGKYEMINEVAPQFRP